MEAFADGLEGAIRMRAEGDRVFRFSAKSWARMENDLFRNFSTSASLLLIHLGYYYGRSMVKEAKLACGSQSEVFEMLRAQTSAGGWGSLSFHWNEGDERNFEVEVKDCVFCAEESGVPSCFFLQGIITGAAVQTFGREYRVRETECSKKGSKSCRLSASLAEVRQTADVFSIADAGD